MNDNMKKFISCLFEFDLNKFEIKAYKYADNYKPDIIITANGFSRYISIKSGGSNSIHQEHLYSFLNFLHIELNFTENLLNNVKLFHFNDSTYNGSGKIRKSANDFQMNNPTIISEINSSLNKPENARKLIDRLLFKGEYYHLPIVDYIYYGDVEKGLWASREEIMDYLLRINRFSASIHVSLLYYQSLHRNLKYDKYYEYKRYYVQFKWFSLKEDLITINKKRAK